MAEKVLVSRRTFLTLLVIGMLASSGISIVASTQLMTGPQGPQGPQGEQGIQGPQGEPGLGVEPGFLVAPAFDSGWLSNWTVYTVDGFFWMINLTHGLDTTEVFVYVTGRLNRTWAVLENGTIHQSLYGGLIDLNTGDGYGVSWALGENWILLSRLAPDNLVPWHEVRVMIWKI